MKNITLRLKLLAGGALVLAAVATAATSAPARPAHKFHTSFTRVEYDASAQSVEITIRTFADDLESILTRRHRRSVRLGKDKEAERLVFEYLKNNFELQTGGGGAREATRSVELRWVGMELRADAAWLYVEGHVQGGLGGARLRNQLLFDLFEDQVNLVNVLYEGKKSDLVFKRGDGAQVIR